MNNETNTTITTTTEVVNNDSVNATVATTDVVNTITSTTQTLLDYIDKGGPIAYLLMVLFAFGITMIFWKFFHLLFIKLTKNKYIYDTLEEVRTIKDPSLAISVARESLDEKIVAIESGMSTIKIIATISPLLGLLGTVVGILGAFESIAATGLGEAGKFASGISLALVTTVMGLIISIPHFIAYNYFNRFIDKIDASLSKDLDKLIIQEKQDA